MDSSTTFAKKVFSQDSTIFQKNTHSNKNEKWVINICLSFFLKLQNSTKALKIRTILAFWSILKQREVW